MEADARQGFTSLASEPLRALAYVIFCIAGHEASSVFAIVVLTRTRLGIEQVHHVLQFAEGSREAVLALASVAVDAVNASAAVLAYVI